MIFAYNYHNSGHYPLSCPLLKKTSLLNKIYRFVRTSKETHYIIFMLSLGLPYFKGTIYWLYLLSTTEYLSSEDGDRIQFPKRNVLDKR
jgi:hypothetical protein